MVGQRSLPRSQRVGQRVLQRLYARRVLISSFNDMTLRPTPSSSLVGVSNGFTLILHVIDGYIVGHRNRVIGCRVINANGNGERTPNIRATQVVSTVVAVIEQIATLRHDVRYKTYIVGQIKHCA